MKIVLKQWVGLFFLDEESKSRKTSSLELNGYLFMGSEGIKSLLVRFSDETELKIALNISEENQGMFILGSYSDRVDHAHLGRYDSQGKFRIIMNDKDEVLQGEPYSYVKVPIERHLYLIGDDHISNDPPVNDSICVGQNNDPIFYESSDCEVELFPDTKEWESSFFKGKKDKGVSNNSNKNNYTLFFEGNDPWSK